MAMPKPVQDLRAKAQKAGDDEVLEWLEAAERAPALREKTEEALGLLSEAEAEIQSLSLEVAGLKEERESARAVAEEMEGETGIEAATLAELVVLRELYAAVTSYPTAPPTVAQTVQKLRRMGIGG